MGNFLSESSRFFSKDFIKICEYENEIICVTNHHVNMLCLTINLIPSLVF